MPFGSQHAPEACGVQGAGHGLGVHEVLGVHDTFGGTGQFVCVVWVQFPIESQQAPSELMHGLPGAQTMPGVGVPPA